MSNDVRSVHDLKMEMGVCWSTTIINGCISHLICLNWLLTNILLHHCSVFNCIMAQYKFPLLLLLLFIIIIIIIIIIHNQKSDQSGFVRRNRSCPMKKNAFVRFITVTHTITSLYPYDWPFGIGYWNAYIICLMGVAYKNLPWSQIFLRWVQADQDVDYECKAFCSDWSDFWL